MFVGSTKCKQRTRMEDAFFYFRVPGLERMKIRLLCVMRLHWI